MKPMTIGEFCTRTGFNPGQVRHWIFRHNLNRKPYTVLSNKKRILLPEFVSYINEKTKNQVDEDLLNEDFDSDDDTTLSDRLKALDLPSAQQLRQLREMVSDGILLPSELRRILGFEPWPADKEAEDEQPAETIETESGVIEFAPTLEKTGGTQ